MARYNEYSIKKLRKYRDEDNILHYCGEIWEKDKKMADWKATSAACDRIIPADGYTVKDVVSAVKNGTKVNFESVMYRLATYTEYERYYYEARKKGFAGIAVVHNEKRFMTYNMGTNDLGLTEEEYRTLLEPEFTDLSRDEKGGKVKLFIFTKASDFIFTGDMIPPVG